MLRHNLAPCIPKLLSTLKLLLRDDALRESSLSVWTVFLRCLDVAHMGTCLFGSVPLCGGVGCVC